MVIQIKPALVDISELIKPTKTADRPFEVVGHRGARGLLPENTLPAFNLALGLGVDSLELDVGMTVDGVLVVTHNPEISPALCLHPNGKPVRRYPRLLIRKMTFADVQRFDCGSLNPDRAKFPHQQLMPGEKMPSLAQVFEHQIQHFPDSQVRFTIECKVSPLRSRDTFSPDVFARRVVDLVRDYRVFDRVTIQSFDWRVLLAVKKIDSQIQTAALVRQKRGKPGTLLSQAGIASPFLAGLDFGRYRGNLAELLKNAEFIDIYSPNFETLLPQSKDFIQSTQEIQQAGFPVIPWTVNDAATMNQLIDLGVNGLITDFPDVLLKLLQQRGLR